MIKDQNFICLPDPNNVFEWYYIVFGLEGAYKGGYYIGKIKCKDTYPSTAPNITIYTDNGKFKTHKLQPDGICLSISDFHQESWNPAWKVTQIVMGLVSFWLDTEYTYGSVESWDYYDEPFKGNDLRKYFAMSSRQHVIEHEKYEEIFKKYADAIGLNKEQSYPEWDEIKEKKMKIDADKLKAEEERKRKAELERIAKEEQAKKDAEIKAEEDRKRELIENMKAEEDKKRELIENRQKIIDAYFKQLKAKGLTKLVGQPKVNKIVGIKA